MLKGQVTYPDGKVHHFEGRRAPLMPSFKTSGAWKTTRMFDGKSLKGWHPRDPKAKNGWAVVDGDLAVVDPKDNSDLVSDAKFQDMQLHLEFNIEPKSNSGVYLRGRYELQILDNTDAKMALDTHGCGAVYSRLAPTLDATKPAGEWQTLDVELIGREVEVKLNGKTVVKGVVDGITGGALSPWEGEPGPLMLQGDHGKVRFRNIEVKSR
jgi:3-keto-disaccharide hydrolase